MPSNSSLLYSLPAGEQRLRPASDARRDLDAHPRIHFSANDVPRARS